MISSKIIPAHVLTGYIWEVLEQEGVMEKIGDLAPVGPIEDEPKFADSGQAYGIYGYAENISNNLEEIREGVYSFRIVSPNFAQQGHIANTIGRMFENSNIGTEAINRWSNTKHNGAFIGLKFTRVKTTYVEGGEAPDSEGGKVDGVVTLEYRYINQLPTPVHESATGGLWT